MALIKLKPDNPRYPQILEGYIGEDAGTVTDPTVVGVTVSNYTIQDYTEEVIAYDSDTKTFTLAANHAFEIQVLTNQTGASATVDIYDDTEDEVVIVTPAAAGAKFLTKVITTTAAKDIQIRVDDQTANGSLATTGQVLIRDLGLVVNNA